MLDLTNLITASGRYPERLNSEELTLDVKSNLIDLAKRVNNLLHALKIDKIAVTSGFRPSTVNAKIGGAKKSLHMMGKACDLADKDGKLKETIVHNSHLLLEYGLWMENGKSTIGWCHLDTGIRSFRPVRVFNP